MATKDLKNDTKVLPSILPVAATGDETGSAVALAGYESATAILTATTASVAGTVRITECATSGGTYTDTAATDVIVTDGKTYVAATGIAVVEDESVTIGYIGTLGFIKLVFDHSADGVISGDVVLSHPHVAPTDAN
jgi:hypothetical protein